MTEFSLDKDSEFYIYKDEKLYGKIQRDKLYLYVNQKYILADSKTQSEIVDILPEGIDLQIMLHLFNVQNPIELLPYLKNVIGNFTISKDNNKKEFEKPILSNLEIKNTFPNILECEIDILPSHLNPNIQYPNGIQNLSLSGYQHKLQVSIIDNVIKANYGDFILKPYNNKYLQLPENEHLNVSFMKEFGFKVPFNAIVYDDWKKCYHYLIKRFDIDENGNKLAQISLNALMDSENKYEGNIEQISSFLKDRLDETQKILFLKYVYANALIYNNDLHKKNIAFVFKDNQLVLSPVYDVINIYAVKASDKMNRLDRTQCYLSINNCNNGIKIDYFRQSCENLELDFTTIQNQLKELRDIYLEKYPQYIHNLLKSPKIKDIANFKYRLLESYKKCLKIAKSEDLNEELLQASQYSINETASKTLKNDKINKRQRR